MNSRIKLCRKTINIGIILFLACGFRVHADNVYVSNTGAGTITKINSSGSTSIFASGLGSPEGLAFDSAGNLYVADSAAGTILEINPAGDASTFVSGLDNPTALAFDPSGNLYVATPADQSILKINSSGNVSIFTTGMAFSSDGAHLATDNAGNLYANTDYTVERFGINGNESTIVGPSTGMWLEGMAVDGAGQLYVSWQNPGVVQGYGGLKTDMSDYPAPYASGLNAGGDRPSDIAFDANGNLYAYFETMYSNVGVDNGVLIEFGASGNNSVITTGVAGTSPNCGYIAVQDTLAVPPAVFVPEPSTGVMMVASLGVLLVGCRFRKPRFRRLQFASLGVPTSCSGGQ